MRNARWLWLGCVLWLTPVAASRVRKPSSSQSSRSAQRKSSPPGSRHAAVRKAASTQKSRPRRSSTPRVSSTTHAPPATAEEADLRKKQAAKDREAAQVRAKVSELKKKQAAVTEQLEVSQQKVERTTRELKKFTGDLRETVQSLAAARKKQIELKARLEKHLDELTALLVAYYKNGRAGYAQALLTSNDFGALVSRADRVQRIVESDNELLQIVEAEQKLVREREAELEQHKQRTEKLRTLVAEKREEFRDAATEQRDVLRRISRERQAYEQYLRELEDSSREIERLIRRMAAERRRRQQQPGLEPAPEWRGGFIRPVSASSTSPFGYRIHPIFKIRKLHTGVDMGAPSGTPIRAAAGGVVIFSGWKRGYGKTVVIDHGGDTATLYAHCSELLVGGGQTVSQGQTIARVGSTGYSTGPHLHWEVRKNGVPVNPMGLQ